jgi:hypothetical protein
VNGTTLQRINLNSARQKVLLDIQIYVAQIQSIASRPHSTIETGIRLLVALRNASYEELNQIQHEFATLQAIEWLVAKSLVSADAVWEWNPRQTGDASEPDLRAQIDGQPMIAGEVTTSAKPQGVIDKRMASTLLKLSKMQGTKFYFVTTEAMAQRARTKVEKAAWPIEVVLLKLEGVVTTHMAVD